MRIVMDDAGDIPAELIAEYNIKIVPINIHFGTEEYLSGVNMDRAAFYQKVAEMGAGAFPKTSQPTPFQMEQAYREVMAEGEAEILTVTLSEKLSGTYASAIAAVEAIGDAARIVVFDSHGGSAAEGFLALTAARLAAEGRSMDDIVATLRRLRERQVVYFTIDSLEFAVRGGRVSSLRSTMASLLNIKPILRLTDGEIVEAGRVRTRGKAMRQIVDQVAAAMGEEPVRLAVIHANAPEDAAALLQQARPRLNCEEALTVEMATAVAINLGPGALGLVAVPA